MLAVITFCGYTMFVWDENKRKANLSKHGLDFLNAARVIDAPHVRLLSSLSRRRAIFGDWENL
jgi:uncharacterized DUF497 family protein